MYANTYHILLLLTLPYLHSDSGTQHMCSCQHGGEAYRAQHIEHACCWKLAASGRCRVDSNSHRTTALHKTCAPFLHYALYRTKDTPPTCAVLCGWASQAHQPPSLARHRHKVPPHPSSLDTPPFKHLKVTHRVLRRWVSSACSRLTSASRTYTPPPPQKIEKIRPLG
jgi:hypothetical protein